MNRPGASQQLLNPFGVTSDRLLGAGQKSDAFCAFVGIP